MSISSINRFSGTQRIALPNSAKVVSPNWKMIPSANMSTLSKEEIIGQVKELADQIAKATTDKEKEALHDKVQELYTQYVSFASPDRKSLYEQALKTIETESGKGKNGVERANPQKTLFDFLNDNDNSKMKLDRTYPMAGGGTITGYDVTGGGFIFDVGYGGNTVMTIDVGRIIGNGVYYTPTPAEQALKQEISDIFQRAVDYSNSHSSGNNDVNNTTYSSVSITV